VTDRETIAGQHKKDHHPELCQVINCRCICHLGRFLPTDNPPCPAPCLRYIIRKTRGSLVQEIARP
jgi:hypothetical protein